MKEFRKIDNGLLFICEECGKTFITHKSIGKHIGQKHHLQIYYDKWLKEEKDGICRICGNNTKFINLIKGYLNTCCKKCKNIYCYEQTKIGMLKKYGVNFNFIGKDIKEKALKNIKLSNLQNIGVEYPFQLIEIQNKIKKNNKEKYSVENQFQRKEIKEKRIASCIKHFGVESPAQNREIFEKQQKTAFKLKQFKDTDIWYQGSYELDFLEKYYDKFLDIQRGLTIKYLFENKNHVYHSDFYIPSLNLIIECKNSYLAKKDKNKIKAKEKAIIINGFKYLMIIEKDYTKFNKLIYEENF